MKALQKLSKWLSDYTSIVVIAIAVVTFIVPGMMGWVNHQLFTDPVSNKFTSQSIIIGIIMFSMGLTLTTQDFKILAQRPFDICVGALAQYLIISGIRTDESAASSCRHCIGTHSGGLLSGWCVIQYHVVSLWWRCGIFRGNDNRIHDSFPDHDTTYGFSSGKRNQYFHQGTANACFHCGNGYSSGSTGLPFKLSAGEKENVQ